MKFWGGVGFWIWNIQLDFFGLMQIWIQDQFYHFSIIEKFRHVLGIKYELKELQVNAFDIF